MLEPFQNQLASPGHRSVTTGIRKNTGLESSRTKFDAAFPLTHSVRRACHSGSPSLEMEAFSSPARAEPRAERAWLPLAALPVWFPTTAVTNATGIVIVLWLRSLTWVSLGQQSRQAEFLWRLQGRSVSLPFPAARGAHMPWLVASSSVFKARSSG